MIKRNKVCATLVVFVVLTLSILLTSNPIWAQADTGQILILSERDKLDLARAEKFLNGMKSVKSNFLQVSSNGAVATGKLYLSRPGKARFEYDAPSPILMIADGTFLIYIDKDLEQVTHAFLKNTPIGFLVDEVVKFSGDVTVTNIRRTPGILRIKVIDTDDPENGSITLVFTEAPFALRKWIIVDPQGVRIEVTLNGMQRGVTLDKELFIHRQ